MSLGWNYEFFVMKNTSNVRSLDLTKTDSYLLGYFQLDDPFDYHSVDCKLHSLHTTVFETKMWQHQNFIR